MGLEVRGGELPIVETWAPPRPLQPRTGPVGSGGTAVTNLLPLCSLSCLSVSSSLALSLHVAACSLHPARFCWEMGDEPEGVRFNPTAPSLCPAAP